MAQFISGLITSAAGPARSLAALATPSRRSNQTYHALIRRPPRSSSGSRMYCVRSASKLPKSVCTVTPGSTTPSSANKSSIFSWGTMARCRRATVCVQVVCRTLREPSCSAHRASPGTWRKTRCSASQAKRCQILLNEEIR